MNSQASSHTEQAASFQPDQGNAITTNGSVTAQDSATTPQANGAMTAPTQPSSDFSHVLDQSNVSEGNQMFMTPTGPQDMAQDTSAMDTSVADTSALTKSASMETGESEAASFFESMAE
jgi:hypothetical protein